jgi:hypothetical protein
MQTLTTVVQWSAVVLAAYMAVSTVLIGTPGFFA